MSATSKHSPRPEAWSPSSWRSYPALHQPECDQHGKQYLTNDTTPVINSWSDCNVGHTFAIPGLGVFVPVASPNAQLSANNLCSSSPCVTSGNPYAKETFSFMTPDHGGVFRWQQQLRWQQLRWQQLRRQQLRWQQRRRGLRVLMQRTLAWRD